MKITQSNSGKYSISNIKESELIDLYLSCDNLAIKRAIYKALFESQDESEIVKEYGYGVEQYLSNLNVFPV